MTSSTDTVRAVLLLTNRLVPVAAAPLTARELWQLVDRVDVGDLLHASPVEIAERAGVDTDEAARLRTLLDAATAFGFEQDRLADGGIELVSALDGRFPPRLRERLGAACPPFLLLAGPVELLEGDALAVVGSRDADVTALDVARRAAVLTVEHGWRVVSGLARGVDQAAATAAYAAAGAAVGVPAEGLVRVARAAEVRRRVHAGELCLASPYAPDAPFTTGNAMGRNKVVHALATVTLVVAAEHGRGGTWTGAKEALDRRFGAVAVWTGDGATPGNHELVRLGARPVADLERLFDPGFPIQAPPTQDPLF